MERRRDILWRVYTCFIGIVLICAAVLGRAVYIQRVQGSYWRGLSDSLRIKFVELGAERGTIYSEDGNMLSTSVPYFNIYIDFGADGLREKNGKRFVENLDSLALAMSGLFHDKTPDAWRRELKAGFKSEDRYYSLKKNLSFEQYRQLRNFPLVRQGRNKSGFITEVNSRRLNPFGLLANRTIGLSRDNAQNVGLERTYDTVLKGENGRRLVRYIASNTFVPVEGSEIDAENGRDIVTTLDVNTQDIAENALLRMMEGNQCEHGTAIVMETATGKIRAMANLGRQPDGTYWEDLNYAIRATEPGSTFKLATLLSLLEDHDVKLTDRVNLEGGSWQVGHRTVHDSESHPPGEFTVQQAFELSSNVGMAKLAVANYGRDPQGFVDHLRKLRLNQVTGVDLAGETSPIVKSPKSKSWSATTLPWMAFGYELLVSPLQTLTLYNAVANNGRMMKPYLVNKIQFAAGTVRENQPVVLDEKICSDETLAELRQCLEGVCLRGTAHTTFKSAYYKVAGKTGTALVANGNRGYADHIYQSSFAGYFPASHPKYTCIVVIKNRPFAKQFLGAHVAGPVFREIADKLMSVEPSDTDSLQRRSDSAQYYYAGYSNDMRTVLGKLGMNYTDSAAPNGWARLYAQAGAAVLNGKGNDPRIIPDVKGMGLKDALYLLESRDIKVIAKGTGKVRVQSLAAGMPVTKNQNLVLKLD